jgi:hypothetical protein
MDFVQLLFSLLLRGRMNTPNDHSGVLDPSEVFDLNGLDQLNNRVLVTRDEFPDSIVIKYVTFIYHLR